ncbi:MAG: hypothetical protein ACR2HB_15845, partial [Dehalococcoidia bacterium]
MPLIETLPALLEKALGVNNGHRDDLVVAVATDLTLRGGFGEEWLVVTKDRLLVYASDGDRPLPRLDLALSDLKAPAADSLVGGGALQATVNGETV